MTRGWNESPVSLDKLDDHLKALLRLKIREFVHLSPWFKNLDAVEAAPAMPVISRDRQSKLDQSCPHRRNDGIGRRSVRGSLHLNGVLR
jgi:hypothetical protein